MIDGGSLLVRQPEILGQAGVEEATGDRPFFFFSPMMVAEKLETCFLKSWVFLAFSSWKHWEFESQDPLCLMACT